MRDQIKIADVLVRRVSGNKLEFHVHSKTSASDFRAFRKQYKAELDDFRSEAPGSEANLAPSEPNGKQVVTFGVYDPKKKDAAAIVKNGVLVGIKVLAYIPGRFIRHFREDAIRSFHAQFLSNGSLTQISW